MDASDFAMQLAAFASQQGNPLDRFIASLPHDLQTEAKATLAMRHDFIASVQGILTSSGEKSSRMHGAWLEKHAMEFAFRWSTLTSAAIRFAELDVSAMRFSLTREP